MYLYFYLMADLYILYKDAFCRLSWLQVKTTNAVLCFCLQFCEVNSIKMRTKYIAISIGTCGLLLFCARVMRNIQPIPTPQFSQLALRAHAPLPIYPQTCNEEATHIYFLKIHKAGSTTVQNIFLRYGFTRNLSTLVFLHAKIFISTPQVHAHASHEIPRV